MQNVKILFLAITIALAAGTAVLAQEAGQATTTASAETAVQMVAADETVKAADLGISDPKILPGNPFYFFKDWTRTIRSALTFNPVKKAELNLQFASEKLVEAQALAQKEPNNTLAIENALKSYEISLTKVKDASQKIQGTTQDTKINALVDKLVDRTIKYQKAIDKIAKDLPTQASQTINETKDFSIEQISQVSSRLATPEILGEKIARKIEEQTGSEFKQLKNLEILKQLENKVPEAAKPAIQQAQENALKRLKQNLETMSSTESGKLKDYIQQLGGDEVSQMNIMQEVEKLDLPQAVKQEVQNAKETIVNKAENKLKQLEGVEMPQLKEQAQQQLQKVKEMLNTTKSQLQTPTKASTSTNVIKVKLPQLKQIEIGAESAEREGVNGTGTINLTPQP